MQRTTGSLWLFRAFDIDVHVHWTWFLVAALQIASFPKMFTAPHWAAAVYLSLFGLVLLHEFGHALACRSVGGKAEDIVLWPLGGIAFVSPPARPGALLWSIVAGPLVNLVLIVPLALLTLTAAPNTDLRTYLQVLSFTNGMLFVFNMVPVYPLDGGQILHALLWYPLGRWKSLEVVSLIGVVFGLGGFATLVVLTMLGVISPGSVMMLALICLFAASQAAMGFQAARHVQHMQDLPRHQDCACPGCHVGPPRGPFWVCEECRARFDTFETRGKCPECGAWYLPTQCPHCRQTHHIDRWYAYRPGVGMAQPEAQEAGF